MKRTKKFLIGLLAALSVLSCSLGFAACGDENQSSSGAGESTQMQKGEKGDKGDKGDTGAQGEKGDKGDKGVGIEKVEFDENGDLLITFTDGTKQTVEMPASGSSSLIDEGATEGLHYQKIAGKEEYRVISLGLAAETDIVISSMYNGLPVTEIDEDAFSDMVDHINRNLTSITIPDSVTFIGEEAFYGCESLRRVYITDMEAWCNISFGSGGANPLCYGANLYLNDELVTELEIPNGVTSIGNYAFQGCISLTSITIPDSVTFIGESAFRDCSGLIYCELESVPSDWNEYWNYSNCPVVWDCKNNDVATDGYIYIMLDGIRYGLKDGAATVGRQASHITTANISASVAHKGTEYPVTSIGDSAFYGCDSLTSIEIPDGVTSIGEYAFCSCGLTSIEIPDSVTSIGRSAFSNCYRLTSVTIGDSVISIGRSAFSDCNSLTSITIPNSVTSIGNSAFDCYSLTSITFKGTKAQWNAIQKAYDWNYSTPARKVVCSDGEVVL